jgi:hypothetical protein
MNCADAKPTGSHSRLSTLSGKKSYIRIGAEAALIAVGVFLGLAGDQWRENATHRHQAAVSLHNFKSEIQANREAVVAVLDYHASTLRDLRQYLGSERGTRNTADVTLRGLQPVRFDQTAWELALATQALTHLDPELAYSLSRIYNVQRHYSELTEGIIQAMYILPWRENFDGFAHAVDVYFSDLVIIEPQLLKLYDAVLPEIDRVLAE